MKLINTEGMAFIGPGSEWFWTAVSGLVLAITFLAIYRQLRLQRDAARTQQLTDLLGQWSSERMARAKLDLLLAIDAGTELPGRQLTEIGFFLQKVGYLVRRGHMDRNLVLENLGDQIEAWWTWLLPPVRDDGAPDEASWQDFRWLAQRAAARMGRPAGVPYRTPQGEAEERRGAIAYFREAVATEEALRVVPVRLVGTSTASRRPRGPRARDTVAPRS